MTKPRIADIITQAVQRILLPAWENAVFWVLAEEAARSFDWRLGSALPTLGGLDDPAKRTQIVQAADLRIQSTTIDALMKQRAQLNMALVAAGQNEQTVGRIRNELDNIVPDALKAPTTLIVSSPFPALWSQVADVLAVEIYGSHASTPEWALTNGLLLAAYVRTTPFPTAALLQASMAQWVHRLGIRSSLVRLPAILGPNGIRDPIPADHPRATALPPRIWSELFGSLEREIRLVANGSGTVHQVLDVAAPVPVEFSGTPQQLHAIRDAGYSLYEQICLAYMALSSTEQLLRAWASQLGIAHLKKGVPASWSNWGQHLPLSSTLRTKLDELYDPTSINLRNRIMHGGLLEVSATGFETTMRAGAATGMGGMTPLQANPFSPENIANHCVEALVGVAGEAPQSLSSTDRAWESLVALTDAEARWGYSNVHCDFLQPDGDDHRARVFRYIDQFAPAAATFWKLGFHGWIGGQFKSRQLVQHMFLALTFEAVYRLTVHMLGESILQKSMSGGDLRVQYRMLDARPTGLCRAAIVDRLVAHLSVQDHPIARQVLELALKARNAAAHGAIPDFTEERWKGEGHIFVKALQLLMEAGVEHMTREAAYYTWEKRRATDPSRGDADGDWFAAETQVEQLLFGP